MSLEMSKIAFYFVFSLFHAHTKHKLWSFTIREGTILSLLNKFHGTLEKRYFSIGELLVMDQKVTGQKKNVHMCKVTLTFLHEYSC